MFTKRKSIKQVEEGKELAPKFDKSGLISVVATHHKSGDVLMQGYMNKEALKKSIITGEAYYWSRARKKIWHKGATSGFIQKIKEIRIDDDQDSIWIKVDTKASCHVGYRSCFYRSIPFKQWSKKIKMIFKEKKKVFDPKKTYKGVKNPTNL